MERNTIELTAHTIITVDEIIAIRLADPVCITGIVCAGVHGNISALEETIKNGWTIN